MNLNIRDLFHELKQSVYSIQMHTETAKEKARRGLPVLDSLEKIGGLSGLIRKKMRLCEISEILSNAQLAKYVRANVADGHQLAKIVSSCLDDCKIVNSQREVAANFLVSAEVQRCRVNTDLDIFEQAIWNVIENAFRYSFKNTTIHAQLTCSTSCIHVTIENTGLNLSASDILSAKKKFWQSPQARAVNYSGCGLGLWIADGVLKSLGGTLQLFATDKNNVTRVRLTLPLYI